MHCWVKHRGGRRQVELDATLIERFWSRVKVSDFDDCWPWTGSLDRYGYGQYGSTRGQFGRWITSRFAWTVVNGQIPEGMSVLHKCDNPSCCNPWHMFLGDQVANLADMRSKGRSLGTVSLTICDVREIRARIQNGERLQAIADDYRVTYAAISAIRAGRTWKRAA